MSDNEWVIPSKEAREFAEKNLTGKSLGKKMKEDDKVLRNLCFLAGDNTRKLEICKAALGEIVPMTNVILPMNLNLGERTKGTLERIHAIAKQALEKVEGNSD
jgi:hypothetical protein